MSLFMLLWPRVSMRPPLFLAVTVVFCARSALCHETKCLEPQSLYIHDRVQHEGDYQQEFPVGSTLTYRCGSGYTPTEIDTWNATCIQKEDGSLDWDIGQYDCRPVSCGHPGGVINGRLLNSDFLFPNKVRYECSKGYQLEGETILYCQSNAQWNAPKPNCRIVECGPLEGIANGTVRHSGTAFGSKAEFSCNHGLKLVGNSTRTCDAEGLWTGEYPHCEAECVVSPGPGSQVLRKTSYRSRTRLSVEPGTQVSEFNNSLVVKCIDGYQFRRESLRRTGRPETPLSCRGGLWDPPEPWCTEMSLGCSLGEFYGVAPPGLVINASTSHVRHNTTFWAFCDGPGLTLVGNGSAVTCLEDDSWAIPTHMKCIEACGNFDTGPGGPAVEGRKESYDLGDSITLSCNNGTVLQPRIERITCLGERWSERALPVCVPAEDMRRNVANRRFFS